MTSAELYALAVRGEVVEEYTPTGRLAHTYDELGNRVSTTISGERILELYCCPSLSEILFRRSLIQSRMAGNW
ncbi:hypothetical protein LGM63_22290 [Burkholderia cepacia]|nr:hypothetical protein [Burkholderia cepacia]MCA7993381.1 hypothetical protein [Burkholderia cepacia]MCA8119521.1 hypothetical protein [Burkholderia cepacia]